MNHIHENFNTPELAQAIDADKVKPLIMEINKKYGLQVFQTMKLKYFRSNYYADNDIPSPDVYFLTSPHNGLMYGAVWADGDTEPRYNFFSRSFKKSRGWDYTASRTLSSIKISTLMRSISKHKAIADVKPYLSTSLIQKNDISDLSRIVQNSVDGAEDRYRLNRKLDILSTQALMSLLETYMGNKNRIDIHADHDKEIKETYESMKQSEHMKQVISQKKNDVLQREFYTVIADSKAKGFAIGKMSMDFNSQDIYTITEPFVRVADLDQYKDIDKLRPILTMFKVHTEDDAQHGRLGDLILKSNMYYEDLDILNHSPQHNYDREGNNYLFIPTGGV